MTEDLKVKEDVVMAEPIRQDNPESTEAVKEESSMEAEPKPAAINTHPRLWDPIRDMRAPSEEEFSRIEIGFGRFVNFLKNREEAGLTPEAVRLLHSFYLDLDQATTASMTDPMEDEEEDSMTRLGDAGDLLHAPDSVELVATKFSIRKALAGRHLNVLLNLLMLTIEAEQKKWQSLLRLSDFLYDQSKPGTDEDSNNPIRSYPEEKLLELKALTREHLRYQHEYITKLRNGRCLLVQCLDGSHRLLRSLRKHSEKLVRRQTRASLARAKREFNLC